jgi:hypothetical protein
MNQFASAKDRKKLHYFPHMKNIPIRSILPEGPKTADFEGFRIFNIREYLQGKDMIQHLHRHDFYFILVLPKGFGVHEIDFVEHPIIDNSITTLRTNPLQASLNVTVTDFPASKMQPLPGGRVP